MKKYVIYNNTMSIIVNKPDYMTRQQLKRNMIIKYGVVCMHRIKDNNE